MNFSSSERQKKIYTDGALAHKPTIPIDFPTLESQARKRMPKAGFDYVATGAGNEIGIQNNLNAFQKYQIIPRAATGIKQIDLSTTIVGTKFNTPIAFAPVGVLDLACPKGDIELAHAAKLCTTPMIFSNQACTPMETCASILQDSPHWFQLYFSKSKPLVESFVQRAVACGSKAIVLTTDTTSLGWRTRDLNNAYLPFIHGQGIAQYTSDPVFQSIMQEHSLEPSSKTKISLQSIFLLQKLLKNYPGNWYQNLKPKKPIQAVKSFIQIYSRTDLNWEDIRWLRSICPIPLLIKGILHEEDAKKAIDIGADGIIVSNHGGRQVDYNISSLDALVNIKAHVDSNFPLLLDSGIRTGTDIFIALALGASSVLIGRPYVYALTVNKSHGVIELIQNLVAELEITMKLCGVESVIELKNRNLLKSK